MYQLITNSNGGVDLIDVPIPAVGAKQVVVKTKYSVISPGTELAMLRSAKGKTLAQTIFSRGFFSKVKEKYQQNELKESIQEKLALGKATHRLIELQSIGYSAAGVIEKIGDAVSASGLAKNQPVACAGAGHGEYCALGPLMTTIVPETVTLKEAAFATLGSICIQGIRRGQVVAGQTAVVMGMGLLGQLTVQILNQIGLKVIATDLQEKRLNITASISREITPVPIPRSDPVQLTQKLTKGLGADVVIITAASPSSEPINQAVQLVKSQGKIVIVGDVRLDLVRRPFYLKEADLVISRAYGPGRYDQQYEKNALDYPPEHVRWTMQRNMQEFLNLLAQKKLQLQPLITHEFAFSDAKKAYQTIHENQGDPLAVLLAYDEPIPEDDHKVKSEIQETPLDVSKELNLAVIGGSNFAKKQIIPILAGNSHLKIQQIVSRNHLNAKEIALSFKIPQLSTSDDEVLSNPDINVLVIANQHDQHAELVQQAVKHNKHVFVEKPIALNKKECQLLIKTCRKANTKIFVDFNRRFAPLSLEIKSELKKYAPPFHLEYRIAASGLPVGHWINDPQVGGGRLLGEAVHFYDWVCWLYAQQPQSIQAWGQLNQQIGSKVAHQFSTLLKFADRSTAAIHYSDLAPKTFPKERIELFAGSMAAVLDNFTALEIFSSTPRKIKLKKMEKGYEAAYEKFIDSMVHDLPSPIDWQAGVNATIIALSALESIQQKKELVIDWDSYYQE